MSKLIRAFCCVALLISFLLTGNTATSRQSLITVNGWNAYVHLPADYSTSKSYATIIFFPGGGQIGTNASQLLINGPSAYIEGGWNGNITIGSNTVEFIVISLQPPSPWPDESQMNACIQSLKNLYQIDNKRLFLTGFSEGAWCALTFVTADPLGGPYTYASQVAAIVNVEGVKPDDNQPYPYLFQNAAKAGVRLANFEQIEDDRDMPTYTNEMDSTVPNSAILTETDFGNGGHCCWSSFFGDNGVTPGKFILDGISQNMYQWFARIALSSPPNIPPVAKAGADQTIQLPTNSVTLTGTGTDVDGTITSYQWTKISGPSTFSIVSATSAVTQVSGLIAGTYKFSLTVKDDNSTPAKDTIQVKVNALPAPVITSETITTGSVKTAFNYSITASNTPISYAAKGLPAGLTVNKTTGVISGKPTATGTSSVTISATNAGGTGTRVLTVTIAKAASLASVITSSSTTNSVASGASTKSLTITIKKQLPTARPALETTELNDNKQNDLQIFPNPVETNLTVTAQVYPANQTISFTISDIAGRILYKKELFATQSSTDVKMDISHFNKGIYLLNMNVGGNNIIKKIIKN